MVSIVPVRTNDERKRVAVKGFYGAVIVWPIPSLRRRRQSINALYRQTEVQGAAGGRRVPKMVAHPLLMGRTKHCGEVSRRRYLYRLPILVTAYLPAWRNGSASDL